ncbi:hypothetical protein [Rhizobium sp. SG2393]|uniref:hypothetical protein n=1 Tax=Rhizobium sp. SG2393 TaxID=3276279 RepID=UPI00367087DA
MVILERDAAVPTDPQAAGATGGYRWRFTIRLVALLRRIGKLSDRLARQALDLEILSDERRRDLGFLDGRPIYRPDDVPRW